METQVLDFCCGLATPSQREGPEISDFNNPPRFFPPFTVLNPFELFKLFNRGFYLGALTEVKEPHLPEVPTKP